MIKCRVYSATTCVLIIYAVARAAVLPDVFNSRHFRRYYYIFFFDDLFFSFSFFAFNFLTAFIA